PTSSTPTSTPSPSAQSPAPLLSLARALLTTAAHDRRRLLRAVQRLGQAILHADYVPPPALAVVLPVHNVDGRHRRAAAVAIAARLLEDCRAGVALPHAAVGAASPSAARRLWKLRRRAPSDPPTAAADTDNGGAKAPPSAVAVRARRTAQWPRSASQRSASQRSAGPMSPVSSVPGRGHTSSSADAADPAAAAVAAAVAAAAAMADQHAARATTAAIPTQSPPSPPPPPSPWRWLLGRRPYSGTAVATLSPMPPLNGFTLPAAAVAPLAPLMPPDAARSLSESGAPSATVAARLRRRRLPGRMVSAASAVSAGAAAASDSPSGFGDLALAAVAVSNGGTGSTAEDDIAWLMEETEAWNRFWGFALFTGFI
ncbi:hypothetical protein HK405_010352, partial [Cladochytrium tenue]